MEIFEGILKVKNPNKNALCFIRTIDDLECNLHDSAISRFIDTEITSNKQVIVDEDARNMLENLKNNKVTSKLNPSTNIFKFNVNCFLI